MPLLRDRALTLVLTSTDGVFAREVAIALGISPPVAACTLGRLYWAGTVDRVFEGARGYRYRSRPRPDA